MSLHALANQMAARGRGPDSTLVHMSPREVHGLQALAMANGGTLTINPQTGLPEAGFLDSLLPALAGFALNAFLPGVGGAIGGALGLAGTAAETVGTGLLVGGATGLATGSLEKGLMAGLGAYGGAGLAGSLGAAGGVPNTAMDAGWGARDAGMSAAAETSPAATAARLQAGANTAMSAPRDFLKDNAWNFGLASAPLLTGTFDDQQTSSLPKQQLSNLYMYKKDPVTGKSYAYKTYSGDEVRNAPPVVFGNANGGLINNYDDGSVTTDNTTITTNDKPVIFGGVSELDLTGRDMNDRRSDSQKVQDYLMGMGPNPFTVYHKTSVEKAADATKEIAKLVEQQQQQQRGTGGGGGSGDARGISPTALAGDVNSYTNGAIAALMGQQAVPAPIISLSDSGYATAAQAESAQNQALAAQYGMYGNPSVGLGGESGSSTGPNAGAVNGGENGGWGSRDAGGGTSAGPSGSNVGATSAGSAPGASASSAAGGEGGGDGKGEGGGDGHGEGSGRGDGGGDGGGHGDGGGQARGGLLNLHRRNQSKRYGDGGTTDTENTVNFGGVGQLEPVNTSDSALSDSERTQNYLMGNGPNPFTFYHSNEKKVVPATKASDDTGIAAINRTNLVDDNVGINRLVDRNFIDNTSSTNTSSDTGGADFGVTNQPPGAVFNINDFDTNTTGSDFGIGNQPSGTTFDINDFNSDNGFSDTGGQFGIVGQPDGSTFNINDFDNNTSAGVGDYGGKDFGVTGQPAGAAFDINDFNNNTSAGTVDNVPTFDINNFDNNTSAGTVNTGDAGLYTGGADESISNVDTSNPEIFGQDYVDPRTNPFEDNANRLEQQENNEGYFGGDFSSNIGSDLSGSDFGSNYIEPSSDFGSYAGNDSSSASSNDSGGDYGNNVGSDSGSGFGEGGDFGSGFGGGFGSGGGCPAPWINITLADGGTIKAGDIKPGMMVYTRHETTGEWGNFPVTVVRNGEDNRWTILFESGVEFVGTFNHPVMVGDAWVEIQHLKAGDKVVQPEGFAVVKSAKYLDHGPIVKIEVQDAHTYLTEGFLSHNKNMVDDFGSMRNQGFGFDEFDSYADGGTTGSGSIDLHVPINIGDGGGGGVGDNFGGGFARDNPRMFGGMSQPNPDFLGQQMNSLPGYQAVQKAQQDFTNSDDYKNFQNYAREYQQQLQPLQQLSAFGGALGGSRSGFGQSYQNTQMPAGYNPNDPRMYMQANGGLSRDMTGIAALAHGGVMHPFFSGRTGKYQEHTPMMYAEGGMYNLGSYSDGGRLLRGPGDGVSDDIPATIGENQPARLADGEFVVPARIVSELGNGSTEAGARKLYAMMDRVQKARTKTVGKDRIAANTRADKYLPV